MATVFVEVVKEDAPTVGQQEGTSGMNLYQHAFVSPNL